MKGRGVKERRRSVGGGGTAVGEIAGGVRAPARRDASRLMLYASITDSRQKHAEWNANGPHAGGRREERRRWARGSGERQGVYRRRWRRGGDQKIDSAIEWDHPEWRRERRWSRGAAANGDGVAWLWWAAAGGWDRS